MNYFTFLNPRAKKEKNERAVAAGRSSIGSPGRPVPPCSVKSPVISVLGVLFYFGGTRLPDAFQESKHEAEGYVCETSHVCNFIYFIASSRVAPSHLFLTPSWVHPH